MKIDSASYRVESTHRAAVREETRESLRVWSSAPAGDALDVSFSSAARASLAADAGSGVEQAADAAEQDPYLQLLISMIELLTGRRIRVFSPSRVRNGPASDAAAESAPAARPTARFGLAYDARSVREETEQTVVAARGVVKTADGREIAFNLELNMSRRYVEENSVSVRLGEAARKDPLVLNFNGSAAQLEDRRFTFDLDADGRAESLPALAPGSAYLAFDRNGNGRIDDGSELFGPATGSGFAELAQLDDDGSGWVDEGDPAFRRLALWTPGVDGTGTLEPLALRSVGAIALGHVASPFELRGTGNADLGAIAASGVFLTEDGVAGSVQEINLTV